MKAEQMTEQFTFPATEVNAANDRASDLSPDDRSRLSYDLTFDPTPILTSFGCLSMKPGWVLRAYVDGNVASESTVIALPLPGSAAQAPLSIVGEGQGLYPNAHFDYHLDLDLDGCLRFMAAVEGDGTPWSYLCASLAVRRLIDFGASDHARYAHDWAGHRIVETWPQPSGPWRVEPGAEKRAELPRVVVDQDCVTVRLYTHSPPAANGEGVWLHQDRYALGSYDPVMTRTLLAAGRRARYRI